MKIVTDAAADMRPEELRDLNITAAPLYIQFPEGEMDSVNITPDAFYDRLESMRPAVPSTAQPSSGVFEQIFRKVAETSRDIFSIHISSGLSGTINAARVGAEQAVDAANVITWDTMTLSGGERFQVLAAAWAFRKGWAVEKVQERLVEIRKNTEVIYTLETLEYLQRGGRIGRVQALLGSMLKLKPVIRVEREDGKYSTAGRGRTIPQALEFITGHLQEMYKDTPVWVNVLHGRFQHAADDLAEKLKGGLNAARLEVNRISPVLGVHTGPGIVGAAIAPMHLLEDLVE